ncbi:unnamed protein product [Absidia cylindrospora]
MADITGSTTTTTTTTTNYNANTNINTANTNAEELRQLPMLTSVRKKQIHYSDTPFYGNCRDVEEFQKLNRVGEGTYGVVYRVRDTISGKVMALKKIRMNEKPMACPSPVYEKSVF